MSFGNRKVLTVFLGSPGDVGQERQAAREVVDELNDSLRVIGCQIDLRGWEDTLPGHGRPQERINADVRACHLFVGLLYTRWGSKTGRYSSGLEEEFTLALDLKKRAGTPEIWLFFKRPPDASRKDPGPKLKRVMKFRKEVEARREVLFKDIGDGEWQQTLRKLLNTFVLHLHQQGRPGVEDAQPAELTASEPAPGQVAMPAPPELVASHAASLRHLDGPHGLDAEVAIRLHLFTQTALYNRTRSEMGVHEINFLYRGRSRVTPGSAEQGLIAVTVLGTAGTVAPGWYWLRPLDENETRNVLLFVAGSADGGARRRAAGVLAAARIPLNADHELRSAEIDALLDDDDEEAVVAKLTYLAAVGVPGDLVALEPLSADPRPLVRAKAAATTTLIAARADPARVLAEVNAQRVAYVEELGEIFKSRSDQLPTPALEQAALHADPQLRGIAIAALEGRGAVTPALARRLTELGGDADKVAGYRALLAAGVLSCEEVKSAAPHSRELDAALARVLGLQPAAALLGQIGWLGSGEVYHALTRYHFPAVAARLRADLADRYDHLWRETFAKLRAEYADLPADFEKQFGPGSRHGRFLIGELAALAIRALTAFGGRSDLPVVREYLQFPEASTRREAVRFLSRHGEPSDAAVLLELARAHWDLRHPAAAAAVTVAGRAPDVVRGLLTSGEVEMVRVGVAALGPPDLSTYRSDLIELLRHPTDAVRLIAVVGCCRLLPHADLEALLDEYAEKRPYYYNVVCWLDRFLYAPPLLQAWYRRQLDEEISLPDPGSDDPLWFESSTGRGGDGENSGR